MKLKIGIPKGSLQESTLRLFKNAGYTIKLAERSYVPAIDDPELEGLVIRAQEMGRYVENGILDMGITGLDWVLEQNSKVVEMARLRYGKVGFRGVKWVVAVPVDSPIKNIEGPPGKEDSHGACGLHDALPQVAEDRRGRRVLLGRNGGKAAAASPTPSWR